jgi:hypothetical protein
MSHYVLAVPVALDDYASWAPFADDTGMGYRGMDADGNERIIMLHPSDEGLKLFVDGELMSTYRVGG